MRVVFFNSDIEQAEEIKGELSPENEYFLVDDPKALDKFFNNEDLTAFYIDLNFGEEVVKNVLKKISEFPEIRWVFCFKQDHQALHDQLQKGEFASDFSTSLPLNVSEVNGLCEEICGDLITCTNIQFEPKNEDEKEEGPEESLESTIDPVDLDENTMPIEQDLEIIEDQEIGASLESNEELELDPVSSEELKINDDDDDDEHKESPENNPVDLDLQLGSELKLSSEDDEIDKSSNVELRDANELDLVDIPDLPINKEKDEQKIESSTVGFDETEIPENDIPPAQENEEQTGEVDMQEFVNSELPLEAQNDSTGNFDMDKWEAEQVDEEEEEEDDDFGLKDEDVTATIEFKFKKETDESQELQNLQDVIVEPIESPIEMDLAESGELKKESKVSQKIIPPVTILDTPSNTTEINELREFFSNEILKYSVTIQNLQEDRNKMSATIEEFESVNASVKRQKLNFRAELDEKKIELSITKKRSSEQVENLKHHLELSEEKREIIKGKYSLKSIALDELKRKERVQTNKIQEREKQLETQLELLKADADAQIKNRDSKITDMKRKIDALEFDLENMEGREKDFLEMKMHLENKLDKISKALENTFSALEEDIQDDNEVGIKKIENCE